MKEAVRLTRRQESFLKNMLDLWHIDKQKPMHYSELAEHVGINRFTAYDMCKLLEEKGMIESSYQVRESGRGRSSVVFQPTALARQRFDESISQFEYGNWDELRNKMYARFQAGLAPDQALIEAMLARLGTAEHLPPSVQFSVELLTIILLRLEKHNFTHHLPHLLPAESDINAQQLILLAGFALGVLATTNDTDKQWEYELIEHVKQYQTVVADMSADELNLLAAEFDKTLTTWRNGYTADTLFKEKTC